MQSVLKQRLNLLFSFAFLAFSPALLAAPEVGLTVVAEKEIQVTDENGQLTTRRVAVSEATPGDTLFYTLTYSNTGDEAATSVKLDNPIPDGTAYVAGTAWGDGADILFSIDNGQTFKKPAQLTYQVGGGVQAAEPEKYTTIRWLITEIPAGSSGKAGFTARVK